ncbi:MAG: tyrosine--tRNA ligase, partial [Mycoplasma sp.]|nr:tyrosine--tRNA ligase [Mycoplasma sp.]
MNKIFNLLKTKNILKDITNESKIKFLNPNDGVYIGFDPSAPSLHLGNYIQINILKLFQKYGFKVFAVLGGATGMIGDPSGKNSERKLLTSKQVIKNKKKIKAQLESFGIEVIDNIIFYKKMSFLSFLREVGKHIGINYMISKESVKSRLLSGLSFTEFSYQLIQGWDFKCLYSKFNIKIQVGGSDQWGNITTGIELIKKFFGENHSAIGLTTNLLLTEDGKKFGKTENNPIWLDPKLTLPYYLYQYLYNIRDDFVLYYYDWLTTNNSWEQLNKLSIKEA